MNSIHEVLVRDVLEDHAYAVSLRRHFHTFPELSEKEYETCNKIEEELDKCGIPHKRLAKTGVYAELEGEKQGDRCILLRADIDALPIQEEHECEYKSQRDGVMHACGHDAHTAALLSAARVLSKNRDKFSGKIIFNFQPGEEVGYGARAMISEGSLGEAQRSFGIHMASNVDAGKIVLMSGPNNASVDQFKITVHGKAAHISTPQEGVDAAWIASEIVIGSQALVSKRTSPMDPVLIGIGRVAAGTAYNILAQEAEIEGTVRVFSEEIRAQIQKELKDLSEKTAEAYGGSVTYFNKDNTSVLSNDPLSTEEAQQVAYDLFGKENVITSRQPALGGDDMAEYINRVPGVYGYVGSRNPEVFETGVAHHNSHFDIDEDALRVAAEIYTCYAVDYLNGNV